MIICFTTDLHGRVNLHDDVVELVGRTDPELLIFGGDMLPDGEMKDPGPVQAEFVRGWLADWLRRFRDDFPRCRIASIFGNHDWHCSIRALETLETEGLLTILRPDAPATFGDWKFLGYSYSPPSPFYAKDLEKLDFPGDEPPFFDGGRWDEATGKVVKAPAAEYFTSVPTIQDDLAKIPTIDGKWIFVSHAPPRDSHLDLLISGQPVGSGAVREFIEQRKPLISLHGHLHDSPYKSGHYYEQIGSTIAINPGQGTATLAAVTFDPDDVAGTICCHGVKLPRT